MSGMDRRELKTPGMDRRGLKMSGMDRRGLKTPGMDMGESCVPAWVKAGSGPLPEDFDVMVRLLPKHS